MIGLKKFLKKDYFGELKSDLVWSDPVAENNDCLIGFSKNTSRNCSYYYGKDELEKFLDNNNLLSLIRAHEVQFEGFKMLNWGGKKFPRIITIFSAPNYCNKYKNKGAIIKFCNNNFDIDQFKFTPSPFYLPKNENLFQWSIPYLSEKGFLKSTRYVFRDILDVDFQKK